MAKVSIDIPDNLKKRIEEIAKKKDYKSSSEYIREALRNQLEKDEEVDVELLYRYMRLEKGEGLEKASSVDEVRKRLRDKVEEDLVLRPEVAEKLRRRVKDYEEGKSDFVSHEELKEELGLDEG